jgi:flavin reductase (DIM6/NTAB) family NADH-FMN oxidoreductase RutF
MIEHCAQFGLRPRMQSFKNPFEPKPYRSALGAFSTGVTIVTTVDEAGVAHGLTVNSFTSVSLDPPLVLWCLGDKSDSFATFTQAKSYAINVLAAGVEPLAMRFAGKGDQTFAPAEYTTLETGCPILPQAIASFDCDVVDQVTAGDHVILIGQVRAYSISDGASHEGAQDGAGMTYFKGKFGSTAALQTA